MGTWFYLEILADINADEPGKDTSGGSELWDRIRLEQHFASACGPPTPPKQEREACRHLGMRMSNGCGNDFSAS